MATLSIKARLSLPTGLMSLMMIALAITSLMALNRANERLQHFVNGVNARLQMAADLRAAVSQRAISARNLVLVKAPDELAKEKEAVAQAHDNVDKSLSQLKAAVAGPGVPEDARVRVAEIERIERQYGPVAMHIVALAAQGKDAEAIDAMNERCRPLLNALLGAIRHYMDLAKERSAQDIADAEADLARQRLILSATCALALIMAAVTGWMTVRHLLRALGAEPADLNAVALRVAAGDLSPVTQAASAPPDSILAALGHMQHNLANIVREVRNTSDSIATGSAQIATGNADLSQRTEEQASNLQETSASMMEIRATVDRNADTARQANQMATSASESAAEGGSVMQQVISTMQGISDSSRKVADIISVIDGIAFQTNILALNAAVEAARAGEQGRGFAVVAGEVRTLARRSAEAAREIKALISDSVERVESGTELVHNAGSSIDTIVSQVRKVADCIAEISASALEQTTTIGQVSDAVGQLDQVTQQNAALVEESAAAAESLKHQAQTLAQLVSQFKILGPA
jgi:methyl-accepting chemotaxis protein-1 (serine sensor receptor)